MSFTGKATYGAGADLPELIEDVSDIIGIVSPFETPLLDYLGDPQRAATSTIHEWIEDTLLPNFDHINQAVFNPDPETETDITVDNIGRFRVGDLVRPDGFGEIMLVVQVQVAAIVVVRSYGGTAPATLADNMKLHIVGNAALEGDAAASARFTSRMRQQNYTQIFASTVTVSGSMQAARAHGISDELDYQKQERLRELLRDLENTVINGVAPSATQQGSSSVRRTMNGIINSLATNLFEPGVGDLPPGGGAGLDELTEEVLNAALRLIWEQSAGSIDTIVVNGAQKRKINSFISSSRAYAPDDTSFRDLVSVYESDFGVARVILSRWMPADEMLLLDSSRVQIVPLIGRSFGFKPLASTGDSVSGQVLGEYTLELKNENAHGLVSSLAV
jgi:Family of unknown function (DUF5309)